MSGNDGPAAAQHPHLEPEHHGITVKAHRAHWHAGTAKDAVLCEARNRCPDWAVQRLTVEHFDGERTGQGWTGGQALIAANASRQFFSHLGCWSMHRRFLPDAGERGQRHLGLFPPYAGWAYRR
jgi:hypothetical protein